MTMGELSRLYPSAPLTLFARFGVGSRDKLGFRPDQKLERVLANRLIFDVARVMQTIQEAHATQSQLAISPERLEGMLLVDVRGRDEFEMGSLPGALFLDGDTARLLTSGIPARRPPKGDPGQPVAFFCKTGPFAGAAAQHFRGRGVDARVLEGGLLSWAERIDPSFPVYGSDVPEKPGRLHILPLRRRARLPLAEVVAPGLRLLADWNGVALWKQRGSLVVERSQPHDWVSFSRSLLQWVEQGGLQKLVWREEPIADLESRVDHILRSKIQEQLSSHKGKVDLVEMRGDVARLALSGGCQGCSGAALTVAEEIASTLMEELPELWAVEDATDHDLEGLDPHH